MLNGKQKRYLRATANRLSSCFQVGKEGVTPAVVNAVSDALRANELIKINVLKTCDASVEDAAVAVATAAAAEIAQIIGRTIVLYKRRDKEPRIILPR